MVGLSYSGEQTLADRSPFTLKDGNAKKAWTHETSIRTEPTENPRKEAKKLSAIIQQRIWDILDLAGCTKFYVSSALRGLVGYYLNLANGLKGNYVNEKVFVVKYAINRQHFQ